MVDYEINIGKVEIENLVVLSDSVAETIAEAVVADVQAFLREQDEAGADPSGLEDIGYDVPEEFDEPDDSPTAEEQEEVDRSLADELTAAEEQRLDIVIKRAKKLHRAAKHVTDARHLEGYKTSYVSSSPDYQAIESRQENAERAAAVALEEACVLCDFRDDCALTGSIERWIDTHAYADKAKRRKGSGEVEAVEARNKFLKKLDAGTEAGEQIHCDPAERQR